MPRKFTPKVITANHLLEGDVIYLTVDGTWAHEMRDAELFDDETIAQDALAVAAAQVDVVVGAYLADAKPGPFGPVPTHFREDFRNDGPSNYPEHKSQEIGLRGAA